ncbi:MAG: hypothetical protein PWR29_1445 [Methanolobus sp.]|nr:hypothetical protein [Methanolobus sp.]MDK2912488.1 hypothetical protein [Methanolobus sp.]
MELIKFKFALTYSRGTIKFKYCKSGFRPMTDNPAHITIEKEVEDFIKKSGRDFRLCTTCGGPAIYPVEYTSPKESDIVMRMGNSTLYVSGVQARYLRQIEMRMIERYLRSLK